MKKLSFKPFVAAPVALCVGTLWCSQAAFAQCGMPMISSAGTGLPSINVAEASTDQVLEQIRRRQQDEMAPPPTIDEIADGAPPAESEVSDAPASDGAASSTMGSGKGFYEPVGRSYGAGRTTGVWVRGFADWNDHSNLAPGQQENPDREQRTFGGMAGIDWTQRTSERQYFQFGAFGGYSDTRSDYSNTQFVDVTSADRPDDVFSRTNNRQEIDGGFVGAYLASRQNNWFTDLAFKADLFDLSQSSVLNQLVGDGDDCMLNAPGTVGTQSGNSSLQSYVVAGNLTYRMPNGSDASWIAPTGGFRYTNTSFGNNIGTTFFPDSGEPPVATDLGLQDGQALRLQGGLRFGGYWLTPTGAIWENELALLAYSDVWVDGFTFTSTSGGTVTPVDEGKVRALGQFISKYKMTNGTSFLFQGDLYGGEDLIGVSGQVGMRYEW